MSWFYTQVQRAIAKIPLAFFAFLVILPGSPALATAATIQGQIINATTLRPMANQPVEALSPQGGMAVVAKTTTDPRGRFTLSGDRVDASGFYLLQATYQGVDYHAPVKFDPNGNAVTNLTVYESTHKLPGLRASSARIIVKVEGSQVHLQELFALDNSIKKAYSNPNGTFSFHISPQAGQPTVAVAGLMNMPLPQTAQAGKLPGDYYITYALKPGLTVVMVAYNLDYTGQQLSLADSIPLAIGHVQLFVSPPDLTVTSKLFQAAGEDTETGSRIYEADNLATGVPFAAQLSGQAAPASKEENTETQEQPQIKMVPDSVSAVGVPLLLCFLLVLLWALGIRVAKEWPRWKAGQKSSPVQKQFRAKLDAILNSISDLDELFAAGKVAEKQYWKERLELKAKAVALLKKGPSEKSKPYAARAARS